MTRQREMTPEDHIALLREWRPAKVAREESEPAAFGGRITPQWRAKWVQAQCENLANLRPVSVDRWGYPPPIEVKPTADRAADLAAMEAARETEALLRRSDVISENTRRLRITLMAESWMREIDVTAPQVGWLMDHHRRFWGIREPVSDDGGERERMAVLAAKRVSLGR